MVAVATIANLSVGAMFLGGIMPGLLMATGMLIAAYWFARRGGEVYRDAEPFSFPRLCRAFVSAIPALTMPAIIIGGILGGAFTPTEAAAIAVLVGFVVSLFIYREITVADMPRLILRAAGVSSAVVMIIGTASIFSWLIAGAERADRASPTGSPAMPGVPTRSCCWSTCCCCWSACSWRVSPRY